MRPPEFTGGNRGRPRLSRAGLGASMRPPEFTGGNWVWGTEIAGCAWRARFNEAAGIHRRKPTAITGGVFRAHSASMRPPEFTGGNVGGGTVPC